MVPYRRERITAFLNPWIDPLDSGYQLIQAWIAVGSGGFFGKGLGAGQRSFYLPESYTDFILAVIGEEFGFVGILITCILFLLVFRTGLQISRQAPDLLGSLMAIGLTMLLSSGTAQHGSRFGTGTDQGDAFSLHFLGGAPYRKLHSSWGCHEHSQKQRKSHGQGYLMFKRYQHIHFIGIGGIGMSGIAGVAPQLGYKVSGLDQKLSDLTKRFASFGATICPGTIRPTFFFFFCSFQLRIARTEEPRPIRLKDYRPPELDYRNRRSRRGSIRAATTVRAKLKLKPNGSGCPGAAHAGRRGGKTSLARARRQAAAGVDFRPRHPGAADYCATAEPALELTIETASIATANTQLMGLYRAGFDVLHAVRSGRLSPDHLLSSISQHHGGLWPCMYTFARIRHSTRYRPKDTAINMEKQQHCRRPNTAIIINQI